MPGRTRGARSGRNRGRIDHRLGEGGSDGAENGKIEIQDFSDKLAVEIFHDETEVGMSTSRGRSLALAVIFVLAATNALAAGFTINEHAAAELGTAYAGSAAAAEDAGTIADNPAGLARLDRPQFVISGTLAVPSLPFTNTGSTLVTGMPTSGANADGGSAVPLPNFFVSAPLMQNLAIGLGVLPSFGLVTDYPKGWVGRYHAQSTNLTSFDFAPTISYRATPLISIGVSPVARYTKAEFSNAIDFGTIGAGSAIPGAISGADDGGIKLKASDWSFGLNGGVLLEPMPSTRVGISYFYNSAARLSGSAGFARPTIGNVVSAASGEFVNTGAAGSIDYPDHLNVGVVQQLSPDIDIRAGVTWTQWSSFKELRISFDNPSQPSAVTVENWRDTYNIALGMTYAPAPRWLLRFGISYDQTPVRSATQRTPRIPDADRITPAIGARYKLTDSTAVDLAYQHIVGGSVDLNVVSATGDTLRGRTNLSADILALQLTVQY
jgi:long-chain fatty acid transport protein